MAGEEKALLEAAEGLIAVHGVGYETAGALLVAAGDNPGRVGHERSFAALCSSSPVEASSGKTRRHRLNRGGDRQANSALWRIVIVRMNSHPPTMAYVARRTEEGLSKKEIIRCLTRYVAREQFPLIQAITAPSGISSNGRARATRSLLDNKRRFTYAAMQVGQLLIRPPTGSDPAGLSVPHTKPLMSVLASRTIGLDPPLRERWSVRVGR